MQIDRNGIEVLSDEECFALLRAGWLGRIGTSVGALPVIFPVVYAVHNRSVVFRVVADSKLGAIGRGDVVCFEADSADRESREGWSVLLVGTTSTVTDPTELPALSNLAIEPWPPNADDFVRLVPAVVSGRRIQGRREGL